MTSPFPERRGRRRSASGKSSDWFTVGLPVPDKITPNQTHYLRSQRAHMGDILSPEELCGMEMLGFEEWLADLGKWEASRYISILKGGSVAKEVRRRCEESPPKKWFHTGLSKSITRGTNEEGKTDHGR